MEGSVFLGGVLEVAQFVDEAVAQGLSTGPDTPIADRVETIDVQERVGLVTQSIASLLAQLSDAHAPS